MLILVGCIFLCSALGIGLGLVITHFSELTPLTELSDRAFPDQWFLRMFLNGVSHVSTFLLPVILYWRYFERRSLADFSWKKLNSPSVLWIAVIIVVFLIPVNQQIIEWNQSLKLPSAFAQIENWMRKTEQEKSLITQKLLQIESFSELLVALMVFGVIGPIGEEVLFRGVLQRKLTEWHVNPVTSIWATALLFSIIHFQFYGFFPRLFLGALFGYFFYWSGNLWVAIGAHVANNSIFVITAYAHYNWPSIHKSISTISESTISILLSISVSIYLLRLFRRRNFLMYQSIRN
ncbi:CPBP family intramembrane glutamic endopeptidase [Dyadobacter luteus]|uniref:CPBP family intramembrane glutamic endopeptidase n=1 Tax=Dyadobacter luteus TaxID=2259619 RepID=UPI001313F816|nr:CPBP family intramembrane glutamic endopeptidase [Dyadobacter luteus]